MNSLANYGSDSDNDDTASKAPTKNESKASIAPKVQSSESLTSEKKRKRAVFTVELPDLSEPTDNDQPSVPEPKPSSSGLFAFLPAPKASSKKSASDSILSLPPPKKLIPTSVKRPKQETTEDPPQPEQPVKQVEEGSSSADTAESFFSFGTFTKEESNPISSSITSISVNAALDDVEEGPALAPVHSYPSQYSYEAYEAHSHGVEPIQEDSTGPSGFQLDSRAMAALGHKSKGGPVDIVDVSLEDQMGEAWRLELARNLSQQAKNTAGFEHLKPTKLARQKHNIMALAFDAKSRENDIANSFAESRANRAASAKKYGF